MRENICNFSTNRSSDLICKKFILETKNAQATANKSDAYAVNLVTSGKGVFEVGKKKYPLNSGTLFFVLKDETFSISSSDGLEYSYIEFYGRRADEYMERFDINESNRVFEGREELIPFWLECILRADSENIDIISEAVLLYSLSRFEPNKKEKEDVVSAMVSLTHDNYTDPELSISMLAERLGYDAKYLSSVFKKRKGIPYTQFLRELRIKHAIFLMEEGVISVKNIALLSGFRDSLYFSKIFTKVEGISPKAYMLDLKK